MFLQDTFIHHLCYSLLPVIVPTPRSKQPTFSDRLRTKKAKLEEEQFELELLGSKTKAHWAAVNQQITDIEELLAQYADR